MNLQLRIYPLLLLVFSSFTLLNAQVCLVDSAYPNPGIYPSDTLPDFQWGQSYSEVVQFVFPPDTNFQGSVIPFDSFVVSSVTGIPAGLNWMCNQNHPVCTYYTFPPNMTRGCVTIFGTPSCPNTSWPAYDSLIVTGVGWIKLGFLPISIPSDIAIYYRCDTTTARDTEHSHAPQLEISPNPGNENSNLGYYLPRKERVEISIFDLNGRKVHSVWNGIQSPGNHLLPLLLNSRLENGVFFVRIWLPETGVAQTAKFVLNH